MFTRGRFFGVILLIGFCAPSLCGDGPETETKGIMRKKLTNAQRVLEGLVINDFDKIIDSAKELMVLTKKNEWRAQGAPQFEVHSNDFRRSLDALVARAREKNGDGTALAYVEMTLSCVRCHKHIRSVRETRLETGGLQNRLSSAEHHPLPGMD